MNLSNCLCNNKFYIPWPPKFEISVQYSPCEFWVTSLDLMNMFMQSYLVAKINFLIYETYKNYITVVTTFDKY